MNTETKNAIVAADDKAQYDDKAKRLLGNKIVLAHILVKTIGEFRGMDPKEAAKYIEGDPVISAVPVDPGLTNAVNEKDGQQVVGMNTENAEVNEGLVRFDIILYVRMKDGLSQLIVNIELQKDNPSEYEILNRAIFYVSRLVSSQKGRDFSNTKYNDIRRVFSIWICMNMKTNSMNYIHLTNDALLGDQEWKGKLDLLNILLIGLADQLPEHDDQYELHRLLGTLLSMELSVDKKLDIIKTEYDIPLEDGIRRDLDTMCNLSQGIFEKGEARREAVVVKKMYEKGYALEEIAEIVEKSVEEVKAIIEDKELILA